MLNTFFRVDSHGLETHQRYLDAVMRALFQTDAKALQGYRLFGNAARKWLIGAKPIEMTELETVRKVYAKSEAKLKEAQKGYELQLSSMNFKKLEMARRLVIEVTCCLENFPCRQ